MELSSISSLTSESSTEQNEPGPSTQTSSNIGQPPSFFPFFADLYHQSTSQISSTTQELEQTDEGETSTNTNTALQQTADLRYVTSLDAVQYPSVADLPSTSDSSTSDLESNFSTSEDTFVPVVIINRVTYIQRIVYPSYMPIQFNAAETNSSGTSSDATITFENSTPISISDDNSQYPSDVSLSE